MKTIADIRREYPQYQDMSDEELGKALHSKYYADMPYDEFAGKAGIQSPQPARRSPVDLNPFSQGNIARLSQAVVGNAAEQADSGILSPAVKYGWKDTEAYKNAGALDRGWTALRSAATAAFGSDEDKAKRIEHMIPGAARDTDANGNMILRLPSGESVYPNRPGLDFGDLYGGVMQGLGYGAAAVAPGGAPTVATRMLGQGAAAGGTNMLMQKAAGREEIDGREALVVAGFAAGGEGLSSLARRVIPALDRMGARATREQKAAEIARLVDGSQPTNARVQQLMAAVDEIDAGADPATVLGREEFGFQYTSGQMMKPTDPRRPRQLAQEEFLRSQFDGGPVVGGPARPFFDADNANNVALTKAVDDRLAGFGGGQNTAVGEVSRLQSALVSARDSAKQGVDDAYAAARAAGRLDFPVEQLQGLPNRFKRALSDSNTALSEGRTPQALGLIREISKTLDDAAGGNVRAFNLRAMETQRQTISDALSLARRAGNNVDARATAIIKEQFDASIDDMIAQGLATGDDAALARLRDARALHADYMRRFKPEGAARDLVDGLSSGRLTPDQAINTMLGQTNVAPAKAITYVRAVRAAAEGTEVGLDPLKAAHFMRLTHGKDGNLLSWGRIAKNISEAENTTPTVLRELYGSGEWDSVKRLAKALEPLTLRGPDANVTGGGRGVRTFMQFLEQRPEARLVVNLPGVRTAVDILKRASDSAAASSATSGAFRGTAPAPGVPPRLLAPAAAAGGEDYYSRGQRPAPNR